MTLSAESRDAQSSSLRDAGCWVKDTAPRAACRQGGAAPDQGASVRSCSPQPDQPRPGAPSRSQAESLCRSALLAPYGAQRGGDTTSSGTQGSVGTAHPPCSLGSYRLHHGFLETTPSSSATYSQQACGMIYDVNILK